MKEPKILIIDDMPEIGEAVREVLSSEYKHIDYVSDPLLGLEQVQKHPYNLVICDIKMPKMEGTEFVHRLRDMGIMAPIIFFTGSATREVFQKALKLGAADVLEKGNEIKELLETVMRVLEIETRRHQYYIDKISRNATEEELEMQKIFMGKLQIAQIKVS